MRLVFWGFSGVTESMWNSFYLHVGKQRKQKLWPSCGDAVCALQTGNHIGFVTSFQLT